MSYPIGNCVCFCVGTCICMYRCFIVFFFLASDSDHQGGFCPQDFVHFFELKSGGGGGLLSFSFPLAFPHLLMSTPITAAFWWVRYAHHHFWSHLTGTQAPWLLSDMISLTTCHTPPCMETDVIFAAVTHVLVGRMLLHVSVILSSSHRLRLRDTAVHSK